MKFKGFIISALLLGLFIVAMLNAGVKLAEQNNVNQTILDDAALNKSFGHLRSNLSNAQSVAENQRESFESDTDITTTATSSFLFKPIISTGKALKNALSARNIYSVTLSLLVRSLGLDQESAQIIFGTFTAIIIILMILLAWGLYKAGI